MPVVMDVSLPVVNPLYFFNEEVCGYCLTVLQDEDDYLLCGREDGAVSIWDLKTLRLKLPTALFAGSSQCLSVTKCQNKLITQDKSGVVKFWEMSDGWKNVLCIQLDYCGFCKLSVNSDLGVIACPTRNCAIELYSFESKLISTLGSDKFEKEVGYVMGCKFANYKGQYFLLVAYENGNLVLWDVKTNTKRDSLNVYKSPLFALDYDDLKCRGICGSNTKKLSVFKIKESISLECIHTIKIKIGGIGCIKIHPQKNLVAVGCWDSLIRLFSWNTYQILLVLSFHSQGIEDICFAPKKCEIFDSECVLFATSRDKKISAWNVSDICSLS